ncbi:MAG: PDGLE domain-containing protein [Clostridia bacterium]|nr:PDGLE domain-containing protein [Clostridia bacterium]
MNKRLIWGLGIALLVAALFSPLASSNPDGLERVAEDQGFLHEGEGKPVINSPIPDYMIPGIKNESLATAAAGIAGTALTFGIMCGLGKLAKRQSSVVNQSSAKDHLDRSI